MQHIVNVTCGKLVQSFPFHDAGRATGMYRAIRDRMVSHGYRFTCLHLAASNAAVVTLSKQGYPDVVFRTPIALIPSDTTDLAGAIPAYDDN